ncbi:hypothetical protein ES319_D02G137100v1 [Gossypium barbadense]|uniref:GDPGP1-like C-terminal domain-containing protein n=1 Tax=Gossypium barbadense TaxID=3634 RepID=A0A5J5SCS5_GOSBA|nr:hypothetical protein ES319_D02G137100v1 [Gossypium barbadense]
MKENGVKLDVVTYTTLMKALIRVDKFHKVPTVYEEMILSGCTPNRKARAMLRNRYQFDQVTEDAMANRLSSFSLDDNNFEAVKQLCCSIASKFDV